MFRPIKNLITYIQKNASGSAIFGGTAAAIDETDTNESDSGLESAKDKKAVIATKIETDEISIEPIQQRDLKMDANKVNGLKEDEKPSDTAVAAVAVFEANCEDDDNVSDIEMQIKRSIMHKNLVTNGNVTVEVVHKTNKDENHGFTTDEEPDELEDFRNFTMPNVTVAETTTYATTLSGGGGDEICSISSADNLATEEETETPDELITEEDEEEEVEEDEEEEDDGDETESFLDLPHEIPSFSNSEVIVFSDIELNSSIASEAPSEDPLAIDDFATLSNNATRETIPLDSSTNDEASTSTDMLWLDIDEIKSQTLTPNTTKDSTLTTTATTTATLTATSDTTSCCITPEQQVTPKTPLSPLSSSSSPSANNAAAAEINSINNSSVEEHAEELRSDGSDSGLGSETSTLHSTLNSVTDTSATHLNITTTTPEQKPTPQQLFKTTTILENTCSASRLQQRAAIANTVALVNTSNTALLPVLQQPLRSNLKRRLVDVDDDMLDGSSTLSSSLQKKLKRSINFDNVEVFYFQRQQGFGCVPSAGGCTLGMSAHHIASKTMTLAEHAAEIRRAHRLQLQEINPRGSSSDDSEESEEDYLSEGSGSDMDAESNGFLQPVSPKQRRALLKAAGVRKIDASEKLECRDIRNSREVCGCTCRDFCDPDTCACSQAGIKCQVDRAMFPCGCSRDACGNTVGRVEFNPARVRTHFIHTIMRLEMENRQQQNPASSSSSSIMYAASATSAGAQTATAHYYSMQTQSNYSSGYASPAYTPEQTANYYQQQQHQQSTHYGNINAADLHQQILPTTPAVAATTATVAAAAYQLDSLDSSLFTTSATPSYGELMPAYGNSSVNTAPITPSVYHNMSYAALNNGIQTQVSAYSAYHHQTSTNYLQSAPTTHSSSRAPASLSAVAAAAAVAVASSYSSCAVPSIPPYGTATTTAAEPLHAYHHRSAASIALETTIAPSCSALDEGDGNNFINLNTPIASSSRLSQINDLLQHNRNTTAALVAISQCPTNDETLTCALASNVTAPATTSQQLTLSSIDTPPIDEARKNCLAFEELPAPLNPTPIVAVLERIEDASASTKPFTVATDLNTNVTCVTNEDSSAVVAANQESSECDSVIKNAVMCTTMSDTANYATASTASNTNAS